MPDALDPEPILAALRYPDAAEPPPDCLSDSPLGALRFDHPFDQAARRVASAYSKGKSIAIDLDDTLLCNNLTAGEGWPPGESIGSIRFERMRRSPWLVVKNGWRFPRRYQYSRETYPFLKNPFVEVILRPGIIAMLKGFRDAGATLLLVSATARRRLTFLMQRLPILRELFAHTVCAEDLANAQLRLKERGELSGEPSLSVKTPQVVREATGIGYDLLIDDSPSVREALCAAGEADRLLWISGQAAWSTYALDIAKAVGSGRSGEDAPLPLTEMEGDPLAGYPPVRFEDPLYFPLIHRHHRLALP